MDKGQLAPWAVLVVLPLAAAATVGSTLALTPQSDELGPVTPHKRVPLCSPDAVLLEAHLGPKLKYSACKFEEGDSLADAEMKTLAEYQAKAGLAALAPGSRVLELGCGWGSLSLTNAAAFPALSFVGFSNSPQQIAHIRAKAAERGLSNLSVFVEDYADFVKPEASKVAPAGSALFDCAIAIETIEHAQNIEELLAAVADRYGRHALGVDWHAGGDV